MSGAGTIRIILVDDHEVVRTGVRRALEPHQDLSVIGEAGNGRELLGLPQLGDAEVVVLDMNLPDTDAFHLIPDISAEAPRARVVVFSMQPEDAHAVAALRAGARGYVSKDRPMEDLIAAIRSIGRGGTAISETLSEKMLELQHVTSALPHETLSARERQIFDRLVNGASPSDIANEFDLAASTVTTYLTRIREKLGVESNFELVQYAFRRKLVV